VSPRDDDEYSFLQRVLATKDRLYLSWVSRDSRTGDRLEPSSPPVPPVLVSTRPDRQTLTRDSLSPMIGLTLAPARGAFDVARDMMAAIERARATAGAGATRPIASLPPMSTLPSVPAVPAIPPVPTPASFPQSPIPPSTVPVVQSPPIIAQPMPAPANGGPTAPVRPSTPAVTLPSDAVPASASWLGRHWPWVVGGAAVVGVTVAGICLMRR